MEGWIALPLLISAGGRPNVFVMSDTSWAVARVIRPAKSPVTLLWEGGSVDKCSISLLQRDLR